MFDAESRMTAGIPAFAFEAIDAAELELVAKPGFVCSVVGVADRPVLADVGDVRKDEGHVSSTHDGSMGIPYFLASLTIRSSSRIDGLGKIVSKYEKNLFSNRSNSASSSGVSPPAYLRLIS